MAQVAVSGSLFALGIDLSTEQVYRAVLRSPGSTTDFLADRVGRSAADVRDDLAVLAESGLVSLAGDLATAEPPQMALGRLLAREARQLVAAEAALAQARLQITHYEMEHQAGQQPGAQTTGLDLIEPSEITTVLESLALSTVGEMLFLRPDQWPVPSGRASDVVITGALRRGRQSRALYPTEIATHPRDLVEQRAAAGERVRLLPHVPCRLAVFGEQAVVIPQTWGGPAGTVLLVRQPGIVFACREWFEELWSHGVGLPELGQPRDRRSRAQLLDLLVRGVKDERIARTLGVSLRTVRRRIAELLAELGVESRFQAGAEAVRRGWL
jgi:DNA-binding CsgD family transcriptional regulator